MIAVENADGDEWGIYHFQDTATDVDTGVTEGLVDAAELTLMGVVQTDDLVAGDFIAVDLIA